MKFAQIALLAGIDVAMAAYLKGQCLNPSQEGVVVAQDVDAEKLKGTWYTIYMDKDFFAGYEPQCLKYDVSVAPPGSITRKGSSKDDSDSSSDDDEQDEGKVELPTRERQAKMHYQQFDDEATGRVFLHGTEMQCGTDKGACPALSGYMSTGDVNLKGPALVHEYAFGQDLNWGHIVDVQYDDYVISYACQAVGVLGMKKEQVFISVRDKDVTEEKRQQLLALAKKKLDSGADQGQEKYQFDEKHLLSIKQGADCKYV